ncbi:MAG: ATP-NAD kinase, partial [Methanoregula sp.]
MRRIGLLVNPVAGMGGSVGLKGTDRMVAEARSRGAVPLSNQRAETTLALLAENDQLSFVTCSGAMGEDCCRAAGIRK